MQYGRAMGRLEPASAEVTGKDTRINPTTQIPYVKPEAMNGHRDPPALDRAGV